MNIQQEFYNACLNGYLEKANNIIRNLNTEEKQNINYLYAFNDACIYGHVHVAQYLLSINSEIRLKCNYENIFYMACEKGHFNIGKWLLTVNPNINISSIKNHLFYFACEFRDLNAAQWLYSIEPDIDISVNNEMPFYTACVRGSLPIMQWLLSIKPTINLYAKQDNKIHDIFECAYLYHTTGIPNWLHTLMPFRYVFVYNKKTIRAYDLSIRTYNESILLGLLWCLIKTNYINYLNATIVINIFNNK